VTNIIAELKSRAYIDLQLSRVKACLDYIGNPQEMTVRELAERIVTLTQSRSQIIYTDRIGLAQWLVPHAELAAKAMEVAEHIAGLPPLAARLTKESLIRGLDIPNLADAALADLYRFMALELTEDKAEAHQAWRERRKPEIKGR